MTTKAFLILFSLLGFLTNIGLAQSSQATMRVSVRIVSGGSVQVEQPGMITLAQDSTSVLGHLKLQGTESANTLINVAGNVVLRGKDGSEINLDISHQRIKTNSTASSLNLQGQSKHKMLAGLYKGEITTTIDYF